MTVLNDCHLFQQWDRKFILISRLFWLIPWVMYLYHYALQLPIYLSLRYVHSFVSDLSPKRQSVIVIYPSIEIKEGLNHIFFFFLSIYNFISCAWLILLYIYETLHPIDSWSKLLLSCFQFLFVLFKQWHSKWAFFAKLNSCKRFSSYVSRYNW